ncbi:ATP-binding protein [Spirillospora sp. NPDC029432]|uniref:ATP-binding protein n=1 Tax=Spirillospora sp. NPDC029432 TaxID=3154599 RepID=UPI0034560207
MAQTLLGTVVVPGEECQVRVVRRWLRGVLGDGHPACHDAELLGSELVTNAILHADAGPVSVAVLAVDGVIRVEVTDAGAGVSAPQVVEAGGCATSGRGLRMVHVLSGGRWGSRNGDGRRTVWFELPVSRNGGGRGAE